MNIIIYKRYCFKRSLGDILFDLERRHWERREVALVLPRGRRKVWKFKQKTPGEFNMTGSPLGHRDGCSVSVPAYMALVLFKSNCLIEKQVPRGTSDAAT